MKHVEPEQRDLDAITRIVSPAVDTVVRRGVKPFFVDRVMRSVKKTRLAGVPADEIFEGMLGWFRPIVVASLLIVVGLIGFNLRQASSDEIAMSVPESVFGLPTISVEAAYELTDE